MPNPENDVRIAMGIPSDMLVSIDRIATALGLDREQVIVSVLTRYLDGEGAEILDDAGGLAELDSGLGTEAGAVLMEARAIVSTAERRKAAKAG